MSEPSNNTDSARDTAQDSERESGRDSARVTTQESTHARISIWSLPFVALMLVNLFQSTAAFMAKN